MSITFGRTMPIQPRFSSTSGGVREKELLPPQQKHYDSYDGGAAKKTENNKPRFSGGGKSESRDNDYLLAVIARANTEFRKYAREKNLSPIEQYKQHQEWIAKAVDQAKSDGGEPGPGTKEHRDLSIRPKTD